MYLLGHQGWTDFLSQFALYIHLADRHSHGVILVLDPKQVAFVERLCMGTGLGVEQMKTTEDGAGVCCVCHQQGNPIRCPRTGGSRCRYPDPKVYATFQGLCVFDNPVRWQQVLASTLSQGRSFVEAFYEYHSLPIETLWKEFSVLRIPSTELPIPVQTPYLAYHMQPGVPIPLDRIRKDIHHVSVDNRCADFFGCIRILEGATELHMIQSSYCMFVYLLQLRFGMFSKTPVFVYASARPNAATDYKHLHRHPQLSNWTFL